MTPQLTCKEFGKFHPRIFLLESSPPESIGNHTMWSQFHPPCFALLRRKNHWSNHGELLPPKQKFQMNLPTRVIGHSTDFFELERIERGICAFHLAVCKPMVSYGRRVGPSWSTWFSSRASLGESYDFAHLNYTIWFLGGAKKKQQKTLEKSSSLSRAPSAIFKLSKSRHFSRSSALSKSVCEVSGMLGVPTSKLWSCSGSFTTPVELNWMLSWQAEKFKLSNWKVVTSYTSQRFQWRGCHFTKVH